ncbi:CHAT domain-containing protein [Mycena vitilis]|nr:CHAT domain-containing protein [Mycena vitilis]
MLNNDVSVCEERLGRCVKQLDHRCNHLTELAGALFHRFQASKSIEDIQIATKYQREAITLCPRWNRQHLCLVKNLGTLLACRFEYLGHPEDADEAIEMHRRLVKCLPVGHSHRPGILSNLARVIMLRFVQRGDIKDIDEAVHLARMPVALRPAPHPDRTKCLIHLANAIQLRFARRGDTKDVDEAVQLYGMILALAPTTHPDRAGCLHNLAIVLHSRFTHQGKIEDLHAAVQLYRTTLTLIPRERGDQPLSNLTAANTLDHRGNREDKADEALQPHEEGLSPRPASPGWARSLRTLPLTIKLRFSNQGNLLGIDEAFMPLPYREYCNGLADALTSCFREEGNLHHIDEAVQLFQEALALTPVPHPDRAHSLDSLANALILWFHQQENLCHVDKAVQLLREALALTPAPHADRVHSLHSLAGALSSWFSQCGKLHHIDEAVQLLRESLALSPVPHPDRAQSLHHLASAIYARFKQQGDPEDVDEAICLLRMALALSPAPHRNRASYLNSLAEVIYSRFAQRGDLEDVDDTVQLLREALALDSDQAYTINNLANGLRLRFSQQRDLKDVNEAVQLYRASLTLLATGRRGDRACCLRNLATIITLRVELGGDVEDIDEAIQLLREVIHMRPAPHPVRAFSLNGLANALIARFGQRGNVQDIDEASHLLWEALALSPAPHLIREEFLLNLCRCLLMSHTHTPDSASLTDAMRLFEEASHYPSASPLRQFRAAKSWAESADMFHHISAMQAYSTAIGILPQLAAFDRNVQSRHMILISNCNNLGSDAAAVAIKEGQHNIAIELLEAARSVFWAQSLHLRTSLDDLWLVQPDLATRLTDLSQKLDRSSFRDTSRTPQSDRDHRLMAVEAEGLECRKLNSEWVKTVESVRSSVPGFEDFMLPRTMAKLCVAAQRGPVVILNSGRELCHALIVDCSHQVHCVELSVVMTRDFSDFIGAPEAATRIFVIADPNSHDPNPAESTVVQRRLQIKIGSSYSQAAGLNAETTPSSRLGTNSSCGSGHANKIRLHINHTSHQGYGGVQSDPLPSFRSMLLGIMRNPRPVYSTSDPVRVTTIIQPNTPGHSPLPCTQDELQKMEEIIPQTWLTSFGTYDSPASTQKVLEHLRSSSIMHFACHGVQDADNPLQSALLIGNDKLTVAQIMESSGPLYDKPSKDMGLAFLCACQTAMGDKKVPDEAMHLAASLLFAGFRSVVATMWTMKDADGPEVAEAFYGHLFRNANPDLSPPVYPDLNDSAEALHIAVKKLRSSGVPFLRWVPFVHYGL